MPLMIKVKMIRLFVDCIKNRCLTLCSAHSVLIGPLPEVCKSATTDKIARFTYNDVYPGKPLYALNEHSYGR